jgi:hypothetical protein
MYLACREIMAILTELLPCVWCIDRLGSVELAAA